MKQVILVAVAILGVVVLAVVAMLKGIDGALVSTAFIIVGGLGGYEAKILRDKTKKPK